MKISNRLRELRARQQLTQAELAKKVAITRQTVIAIEKGEYLPSLELAYRLADALQESIMNVFPAQTSSTFGNAPVTEK